MPFEFQDQGIITVFTNPSAKNNMTKMDSDMLTLFYGFLKKINCVTIEINSTYRAKDFSHGYGRALDINKIIINQDGLQKTLYFNIGFGAVYNDKDDEIFYDSLVSHFGSKLYNYYSPAIIQHAGKSTKINNQFRYAKNKIEVMKKMEDKDRKDRGLHESHLNHLHIAIDHDGKMLKDNVIGYKDLIKKKSNSSDWTSLIPPAILAGYALKEYMRRKK